jgi:urease accessory protein
MHASAHLTVARSQDAAGSRITRLHSDPPFVLRPTRLSSVQPLLAWTLRDASPVHVSVAAGAAGPIGGDDLRLGINVEAGAALILRSVAATLVLPGPRDECSRTECFVRVAAGGVLVWLPGPVIAAQHCHHQAVTQVMLEPGARLLLREELLLGRHGEQPGLIRQRLRLCLDGCPVYDQEIAAGPGIPGWNGPAVMGGRRALGSILIVDPNWSNAPLDLHLPAPVIDMDTAFMALPGPAVLVTALASDGLALRHRLDTGLAAIEASLR